MPHYFYRGVASAQAQVNAGDQKPEAAVPFTMTQVASFNRPWRIAFLPDGRMLVTEKVGPVYVVTPPAKRRRSKMSWPCSIRARAACSASACRRYTTDDSIYLTYSEPGEGG